MTNDNKNNERNGRFKETLQIIRKLNKLCGEILVLQNITFRNNHANNTEDQENNDLKIYFFKDKQWMKTDLNKIVSKPLISISCHKLSYI